MVCGIYWGITYYHLCYATLCIRNGAQLIALNHDNHFKGGEMLLPAGGTLARMVEEASETKATMMGKPETTLFDNILRTHGLEAEPRGKFLMVGDNPRTDIAMGNRAGIDTLLVLSGVTSKEQVEQLSIPEQRPTYVQPFLSYSA